MNSNDEEGAPSIRWCELPAINCLQLSVCHYQPNYGPWHCSKSVCNTCANWCVEWLNIKCKRRKEMSIILRRNKKREVNLKKVSQFSSYSLKIHHFHPQKGQENAKLPQWFTMWVRKLKGNGSISGWAQFLFARPPGRLVHIWLHFLAVIQT